MGETDGALQLSIFEVGVAFDHPQRGPAANRLYRSKRHTARNHHGRSRVAEGMVTETGDMQPCRKPRKRHAD